MSWKRNGIFAVFLFTSLVGGFWILKITQPEPDKSYIAVPAAYTDSSESQPIKQVFISELAFLLDSLKIVRTNGWGGKPAEPLPLSLADYDPGLLKRFVEREREREVGITIPDNLAQLYLSREAQEEIAGLIRNIRIEYLSYAKEHGVAQKYLDEINQATLPDDSSRFNYYPSTIYPGSQSTNVHTFERSRTHSQLQLDVYASNVYKYALEMRDSGVLGSNERAIRDMALRYVVFHEMTHVLQHAFNVVNAPANAKDDLMPWAYAPRSILDFDSTHYQKWGSETDTLVRDSNNMEIAKESQAEGVSFAMLFDVYALPAKQRESVWNHHFGPLKEGTTTVNEFFRMFAEWYPTLNPGFFVHQVGMQFIDGLSEPSLNELGSVMVKMQSRLDGVMATHVGYLNPMTDEEVDGFWEHLKK